MSFFFTYRKGSRKGEILYTWPSSMNKVIMAPPIPSKKGMHPPPPTTSPPPPPGANGHGNGYANGNGHHYTGNGYSINGVR